MHRSIRFARLLVVTIVAGATVGAAQAQTASATPSSGTTAASMPSPGMHDDGPGRGGHRMAMELGRLKTSLRLNASQLALWDRAQAQMMPSPDARQRRRAMHVRMTAMLDDPNFDPRRLAGEMDSADTERRAWKTSVRDAWFAVYDALDPVQRGQAREFLRSRMGHMRHMQGRTGDGGEHLMRGRMADGMVGRDRDAARPPLPGAPTPPAPPTSR